MTGTAPTAPTAARAGRVAATVVFLALAGWIYYRYVPLVPGYQAALAPVLALAAAASFRSLATGLRVLAFLLPVVNGLPYLFGFGDAVPHAPAALIVILAFLLGRVFSPEPMVFKLPGRERLTRPLLVVATLTAVGGAIAFARYSGFYPFGATRLVDMTVNPSGLLSGGARMSVVFGTLSGLAGCAVFALALKAIGDDPRIRRRLISALSAGTALSLLFAVAQKVFSPALGNTEYWVKIGQLNGAFKDPNSLGAFVSALLPSIAAAAIASRGARRAVFAALAVFACAALPLSGCRTAFAATLLAGGAFAAFLAIARRRDGEGWRSALRPAAAGALIVAVFAGWTLLGPSVLKKRLISPLRPAHARTWVEWNFPVRWKLWKSAARLARQFPATGVGPGAFIVELPQEIASEGLTIAATDSALNFELQAAAETGLPGLLATIWLLAAVAAAAVRGATARDGTREDRRVSMGAAAGLAGFGLFFQLHTFIASFEVIALFWMLAAIAVGGAPPRAAGTTAPVGRKRRLVALGIVTALFAAAGIAVSAGPLSVAARSRAGGWEIRYGVGPAERDDSGRKFRWTGRSAGFVIPARGARCVLPVMVAHPDASRRPVVVRAWLEDSRFRRVAPLGRLEFRAPGWQDLEFAVPAGTGTGFRVAIETSRDWSPREMLGRPDARRLGAAIGNPRFVSPGERQVLR